jgi:hypothetical protein
MKKQQSRKMNHKRNRRQKFVTPTINKKLTKNIRGANTYYSNRIAQSLHKKWLFINLFQCMEVKKRVQKRGRDNFMRDLGNEVEF